MTGQRAAGAALAAYPNPYGLPVTEIRDLAAQAGIRPSEYWATYIAETFTNGQTFEREATQ